MLNLADANPRPVEEPAHVEHAVFLRVTIGNENGCLCVGIAGDEDAADAIDGLAIESLPGEVHNKP